LIIYHKQTYKQGNTDSNYGKEYRYSQEYC